MQYYILNMEQLHHIQSSDTLTQVASESEKQIQPLVYQLLYITNGSWRVCVSGQEFDATRDALVFIPAQVPYTLSPVNTDSSLTRIAFSAAPAFSDENRLCSHEELMEHLQYFAFAYVQERWAHIPLFIEPTLGFRYRTLVEQLYSDYYIPAPGTNLMSKSLLHLLLSRISADNAAACLSRASTNAGSSTLIHNICEYLNGHYTQKITLTELSKQFHLSSNYLCSLFKETTGLSIIEYLNARRLEAAKLYLVNTDSRIQDVAQAVGISDEFYFSRLFKRHTGITPTSFRTQFRPRNS